VCGEELPVAENTAANGERGGEDRYCGIVGMQGNSLLVSPGEVYHTNL